MRKLQATATIVLAFGLVLAGSPASEGARRVVKAQGSPGNFHWQPTTKQISKGDKVVWKNRTDYQHTVSAYKGSWKKNTAVPAGGKTAKRFRKKGVFYFRCLVTGHSSLDGDGNCTGMCGKIVVGS